MGQAAEKTRHLSSLVGAGRVSRKPLEEERKKTSTNHIQQSEPDARISASTNGDGEENILEKIQLWRGLEGSIFVFLVLF